MNSFLLAEDSGRYSIIDCEDYGGVAKKTYGGHIALQKRFARNEGKGLLPFGNFGTAGAASGSMAELCLAVAPISNSAQLGIAPSRRT